MEWGLGDEYILFWGEGGIRGPSRRANGPVS